ncbi:hypothetical protein ANCDUO_22754 [Ancylostoma duodenale]|uniref:ATP-dependent DNA helicase n=1 Tax=Ancylostoma duodenale TaxID=51022 RepID=A0A0C2FKB3_9BILA|nr:hypothetical protein ANCDUO_22754 [Ancylostoma duodenale]
MPKFKVKGQIYHRVESLLPLPNETPKFSQIYFIGDEGQQVGQRCEYTDGTRRNIVLSLQRMFHQHNNLVKVFTTALERMPTDEYRVVIRADKTPVGEHERRFNAPTVNEVAVVMVGDEFDRRDIIIQKRNDSLQRISETHRSYDALQYTIIFWEGEDGYHFNIMQTDPRTGFLLNKKVSANDFYASRIMARDASPNHLLKCRQLFHQFIVDMYAKIGSERLLYIRLNQRKFRVDDNIYLRDAVANDGNCTDIGRLVILPATFTGSPRHMHEYAQDSMLYVRTCGRPDLFITFTCNPDWTEIKDELFPGQVPSDRQDLIARVFNQKLTNLMDVIIKSHIYGETRCWLYSVEWQKRGLPHAHILIWLKGKIHPTQIDDIISEEIPNPEQDPGLFEIVTKNMIHGPCGPLNPNSPCMKDRKCSKRYPREFIQETHTGNDGYPLYRRRKPGEGGFAAVVKVRMNNQQTEIEVDNRWVVPYSPLLSKMFEAHINVEYCNSVKSCKYVNKGSDMAVFRLEDENGTLDEIMQYLMGRYISTNEGVWHVLGFPIHERYPTVVHLSVHLENGQRVYFTADNAQDRAARPPNTTLTAFFLLCQQDPFARTLLYSEVPEYYTWNASRKVFCKRKQGAPVPGSDMRASDALGRVYTVHPSNDECNFLRLSLHTSEVLRERSYNAEELHTYVQLNRPLLVNDQKLAYDAIMHMIRQGNGGLFFFDAPGGTGKTFLINLLLAEIREQNEIAVAVASSGIAATLLGGGRTAHSALKLPLDLARSETPVCSISKGSGKAEVLKRCKVIVWDECTMAHKRAREALDRTLQDLRGNNRLMGGAVVVLAGDFRQTLPVIPRSSPADELNACLKSSYLWRHVQKMTLTTNMRVHLQGDLSARTFAQQLLRLGDGKFPVDPDTDSISFPKDFCNAANLIEELIDKVFPDISTNFKNHQWLRERAILAPMNESVNNINIEIQNRLPGPTATYDSIDTVVDSEQAVHYPTEFLNSLEPPGMPPHRLILKAGSPMMLLRNIDPPKLCNGTRLCVKNLMPNVIEATLLTGKARGENVFIPRIPMIPTDMPFDFNRLQFPVRLAFAITIKKAQGQSLRVAGINLETPCFSHGQLYVASSRVGTPKHLHIYAPNGRTKNVVYPNALS